MISQLPVQAAGLRMERGEAVRYEKPVVTDFGSIADHTFNTPGGTKGCQVDCHIDNFGEQSANAASP